MNNLSLTDWNPSAVVVTFHCDGIVQKPGEGGAKKLPAFGLEESAKLSTIHSGVRQRRFSSIRTALHFGCGQIALEQDKNEQ